MISRLKLIKSFLPLIMEKGPWKFYFEFDLYETQKSNFHQEKPQAFCKQGFLKN
jgi:hypothetical protein